MDQKSKNEVLKKLLEPNPQNPHAFWAGGALDARSSGYLDITIAQKWHFAIFQISLKKNPGLKRMFLHILDNFGEL